MRQLPAAVAALLLVVVVGGCGDRGLVLPGLIAVPTQEPVEGDRVCLLAIATGTLVRDPRWGIALDDPAGFLRPVIWPHGFAAREGVPVTLLDETGQAVAAVGDRVRITGGEIGSDGPWLACGAPTVLGPGE